MRGEVESDFKKTIPILITGESYFRDSHTWSFHRVLLLGSALGVNFTAYMVKGEEQVMLLMQVNGKFNFNLEGQMQHTLNFVVIVHLALQTLCSALSFFPNDALFDRLGQVLKYHLAI